MPENPYEPPEAEFEEPLQAQTKRKENRAPAVVIFGLVIDLLCLVIFYFLSFQPAPAPFVFLVAVLAGAGFLLGIVSPRSRFFQSTQSAVFFSLAAALLWFPISQISIHEDIRWEVTIVFLGLAAFFLTLALRILSGPHAKAYFAGKESKSND